jgi:hypothetical protein
MKTPDSMPITSISVLMNPSLTSSAFDAEIMC